MRFCGSTGAVVVLTLSQALWYREGWGRSGGGVQQSQQQRTGAWVGKAEVGQGSRGRWAHIDVDLTGLVGWGLWELPLAPS